MCKKIKSPSWAKSPLLGMAAKASRDGFTKERVQSQMHSFGRYKEIQVYLEVGHRPQDVHGQVFLKD